jgi:hypothetical protein
MNLKFWGNYVRLKRCVSRTGVTGQWRELKNGHKQFRTKTGAILNWWESTGTIEFQGRDPGMKFERAFISAASAKARLEPRDTEQAHDPREENVTLRKLIQDMLVENAALKQRVSKLKERPSEKR